MSGDVVSPAGIMTLAEWRKSEGISQKQVAERISALLGRMVQAPNVCQWESGVMPGADVAEVIRSISGGAVTGASFGRPRCPRA